MERRENASFFLTFPRYRKIRRQAQLKGRYAVSFRPRSSRLAVFFQLLDRHLPLEPGQPVEEDHAF
jgi:hypothetical protein